jgi:integrase
MAMLNLIGRMNGDHAQSGQPCYLDPRQGDAEVTPHGFRSTFRDWAAERTNFPTEVVEMALAHAIDDKVEAAYRRGDLFDKRWRLMDAWAEFCAKQAPAGTVVNLRQA